MYFTLYILFILFNGIYCEQDWEQLVTNLDRNTSLKFTRTPIGINLDIIQNGKVTLNGNVGMTLQNQDLRAVHKNDGISVYRFDHTNLTIAPQKTTFGHVVKITWERSMKARSQDCYGLGEYDWYGGPELREQLWPIQKLTFKEYSYITKELDSAAIAEPYWLSSSGLFFYVTNQVPLFVDQNSLANNTVCFISEVKPPYSNRRSWNHLEYYIGLAPNPRIAHEYVTNVLLKKPVSYPDYRMTKHPIWSTWAEYKTEINETAVMDFARSIIENNFNNSQLEIDDLWETCYGSFNVDVKRFPDLKNLTDRLKAMGFRVTVWIHPFINKGCEPWYTEALQKGYFVKNEEGSVDTEWWDSAKSSAAYIDFTNKEASAWWASRLSELRTKYGIDSFKFDAGETSWSPQIPVQSGNVYQQPGLITTSYVNTCAQFGPMVEVRTGQGSQELPIYVRMIDKDTRWTFDNGLPTLVTTLLQMNMNGYPFVLPDMIGGNGYNERPSKELFIRWLQANVFMPSLQYSYVPWDFDEETINISHKFTDLHADYADAIIEAFKRAVSNGAPVNPPIWWVDPLNKEAHKIWDEYLLGEDILVAPVLEEKAVSRDVYLPSGEWLAEGLLTRKYKGGSWIYNYSAPLDTLPYFIRAK